MYIYVHASRLSSFMPLPFRTFRKMPFDHSFLSKGVGFSVFFIHCSITPCFWEGVDVGCQSVLLSSCIALLPGKTILPLFTLTPLGGDCFFLFQETLRSSFIALSVHAFGRGGCWMSKCSFFSIIIQKN